MDIRFDPPFSGGAADLLLRRGRSDLAEILDRLVEVPRGLDQRLLALHDSSAGAVAERLHLLARDRHLTPRPLG